MLLAENSDFRTGTGGARRWSGGGATCKVVKSTHEVQPDGGTYSDGHWLNLINPHAAITAWYLTSQQVVASGAPDRRDPQRWPPSGVEADGSHIPAVPVICSQGR